MRKDETSLVWDEQKIPEAPFHIICNIITYDITLSLKTLGIKGKNATLKGLTFSRAESSITSF